MTDKIKEIFEQRISQKVATLIERAEVAIAQNLFEKGEWLGKTQAGGELTKVKTKADERKMEKDLRFMGTNVPFKAPEISALRKKGYIPAIDGDDMMLVSRDSEEGEAPVFTVMKYKSKRDGTFSYLMVFNMPIGDAKKYEIYTSIEDIPMWKDAKKTWIKAKSPEVVSEEVEQIEEAKKPDLSKPAFKIFKKEADNIKKGACATCGGEVGKFKNAASEKEYGVSGMCQKCQDKIFG